jgi:hypothetical protein
VPSANSEFGAIQGVAPSLGIDIVPGNMSEAGEIERGIAPFARSANNGLIILMCSPPAEIHRELIITLAARHKLPAVYCELPGRRRRACVRDQRNNLPEKICSALPSVRTTRRRPASWKEFGKASANSTPNSCSERQITRHLWAESAVPTKCSVNSFGTVPVSTPPSFAPHLKRFLMTQSRRGWPFPTSIVPEAAHSTRR